MKLSDIEISFEYGTGTETERREIERNIKAILSTPMGTCPLYRDFGLDFSTIDVPAPVAQNMLTVEIIDAIEKWEPRASVMDVSVKAGADGEMLAKVVIAIGQST